MATLTAFNTISNTTIADGDALCSNIDIAKNNDDAMLSETISTYNKAKEVHDTVSSFSAKDWLNTSNRNFSEIVINDTYTAKGASKLGSTFTFSAGDHMTLHKSGDTYSFSPDGSVANVSSYFKYARFATSMPVGFNDPFMLQCAFISMNYGSFAMHDQFAENVDGFCKTDFNFGTRELFNVDMLNSLGYSATTKILTSAELPTDEGSRDIQVLSHTLPKHGSFLYAHYDDGMPYRGAAILDNCSISMSHNNFVTDYSISLDIKGSSASNHSFIMGNDTTQMWGGNTSASYILRSSMIATNSSTCFGPGVVVNDRSIATSPTANCASAMLSATHRSVGLVACNAFRGAETDYLPAIADKSFMILCNGTAPFTAKDSIVLFNDKLYENDYGYTDYSANRTLSVFSFDTIAQPSKQTHDNSVEIITCVSNAKDSVLLGVKGGNYSNSRYTVNNSLMAVGKFYASYDTSVSNSCLIGFAGNNTYTTTYTGCYTIASPILSPQLATRVVDRVYGLGTVMYDFTDKNTVLLAESTPIVRLLQGYNNVIVTRVATAMHGNGNVWLKGSNYHDGESECNNNFIIGSMNIEGNDDTVVDDNEIFNINYDHTLTALSACYVGALSRVSGPKHYTTITTVDHTVAAQYSSAYSNNSLALCYSEVDESWIYTGEHDTSKNYCLSMFNSLAKKTTYHDGIDERTQLAMWRNKLIKSNLPKRQFIHVAEIDDVTTLENDIYYIIG